MDQLWLEAPAPAVRLWTDTGGLRWRLNRAALEWSLDVGLSDAAWAELAPRLNADLQRGPNGWLQLGPHRIRWTAIGLAPGHLAWLAPDEVASARAGSAAAALAEKFELAQEFGRLGLFERDLRSGAGRWDKHMFRLFGIDPVLGSPPFAVATERVHPDDRDRVQAQHRQFIAAAGRYENRYRLLLPGGSVRDIHSLVETRAVEDGKPTLMIGVLFDDTESSNRVRVQQAMSAHLGRALELAGVSVWRIDLAQQRADYNPTGWRLLGLPEREGGLPLDELRAAIHPEDVERVLSPASVAPETEISDVMARHRHADGTWRHLLTRRAAERDAQGRVIALSGVSLDQTAEAAERERAQALRRSGELVADAAGVGLWGNDLHTGQVEWNAQMLRIHGLPEGGDAPGLGRWLGRLTHPGDRRTLARRRREVLARHERGFEMDLRIVRPDGEVRWVVCRSTHEVRAGRPFLVGIHLDVTERRATAAELARQQERLAMATGAAGLGVWERGLGGEITYWDAQMYRLRGLQPDDPRPMDEIGRAILGAAQHQRLAERARRSVATGEPYEHEFRCVWPDGSERWIVSFGAVRRDPQGRPQGMVGVNIDVTQRRRADEALRERDAAERASRTKSEFLARMSHELRTPLNAVLGFAQIIEHDGSRSLSPQQLERVSRIRTAGQHLLSLIEDVLDLSAVEAGTLPIAREPVSIDAAIEEVRQWIVPVAERHGVTLHAAPTRAWVAGDPRRVRQVLANLLTNAIKYNRPGGNVWVQCGAGEPGRCVVTVRDDGRGLTAQQREHLFEPFNRLGAESEGVEGVGLGLVVVRRLVETMGGAVRVDSAPGRGTAMYVDMPASAPGQGGEEPPPQDEDTAFRPADEELTILYIEDNPVNVLLVEELVALREHMRLTSAPDGLGGVRKAVAERPDVVLIDMQLPDIDGYEVLRRLRKLPAMVDSRLIALSANAMPDDVERALAAGFDDYWTMPIDFTRFLEGLDRLARLRSRAVA